MYTEYYTRDSEKFSKEYNSTAVVLDLPINRGTISMRQVPEQTIRELHEERLNYTEALHRFANEEIRYNN